MGRPDLFDVVLLQPLAVYSPGSWIEGVVMLRLQESIKARAIRLKFTGEEKVSWQDRNSNNKHHTGFSHHSKSVHHLNAYITLWGYPKGTNEQTPLIPPGSYVFPFCLQVPAVDTLPPTCDYSSMNPINAKFFKAYVVYALVAYFDIPWALDIEVIRPICIVPRIPLPADPAFNMPVEQESIKQICCLFCKGGTIQLRVRCLCPSVLVGQPLAFVAEIINNSNSEIVGVQLSLLTSATFHTSGRTKQSSRIEASVEFPIFLKNGESFSNLTSSASTDFANAAPTGSGVDANQQYRSQPFLLPVPVNLPPAFASKAIVAHYEAVFRVRLLAKCSIDVRVSFMPRICNLIGGIPMVAFGGPTMLNPTGQPRNPVLLAEANQGELPVCFSFDGLDCRPEEQFEATKPVAYPTFYDPKWNEVPSSVNSLNPGLAQVLLAPQQMLTTAASPSGFVNHAFGPTGPLESDGAPPAYDKGVF